jgi:hypothetical protein
MGEQHHRARRIPSGQGPCVVRRVVVRRAGDVVDAGQVQPARQLQPFVAQRTDAEARDLVDPALVARVVLVVAGDEEGSVPSAQATQRLYGRAQLFDRPVDQVAHDRDQVGVHEVDELDDAPGTPDRVQRAEVDVADQGDPHPVAGGRQLGQADLDPLDHGVAERARDAGGDNAGRGDPGGDRHSTGEEKPPAVVLRGNEAAGEHGRQLEQRESQQQVEDQGQPQVRRPRDHGQCGLRQRRPATGEGGQGQDGQAQEHRGADPAGSFRPGGVAHQTAPQVVVDQW